MPHKSAVSLYRRFIKYVGSAYNTMQRFEMPKVVSEIKQMNFKTATTFKCLISLSKANYNGKV